MPVTVAVVAVAATLHRMYSCTEYLGLFANEHDLYICVHVYHMHAFDDFDDETRLEHAEPWSTTSQHLRVLLYCCCIVFVCTPNQYYIFTVLSR